MENFEELQNKRLSDHPIVCRQTMAHQSCQNQYWKETRTLAERKSLIQIFILTSCCNHDNCKCYCFKLNAQLNHYYLRELYNHTKHSTSACKSKKSTNMENISIPIKLFQNWIFSTSLRILFWFYEFSALYWNVDSAIKQFMMCNLFYLSR